MKSSKFTYYNFYFLSKFVEFIFLASESSAFLKQGSERTRKTWKRS